MKFSLRSISVVFALSVLFGAHAAFAGFGVTPPFVRNTSLTRNSTYEQQILLVRGDPTTDLRATVVIDAPEVANWVTILHDKTVVGSDGILLPKGEQKVPMTVRVTVPKDAAFKNYNGAIRIKTEPASDKVGLGAVNISLGAQIDLELTVIDKQIKDFQVRKINVSDLNAGHKVGWLYFPGKINFKMLIQNTGNVPVAPSDVSFDIYGPSDTNLLETTHVLGAMKKIDPYATGEVVAALPTHLPPGAYRAHFKIMNDTEVKLSGEVNLNIVPYGTLQTAGYGFIGLSFAHKLSILLPIFAFIIAILMLIYSRRERKARDLE